MPRFALSESPIDAVALQARLRDAHAGACASFEGWVRDHNDGRAVLGLRYEAYAELAGREGEAILIEGHWARPNPQWQHAGEALMLVHGAHAYVSPGWYPDKHEAARVPTWNYVAAHLHGPLELFHDQAALGDLVQRLSAHFEARNGSAWEFDPTALEFARQLRGIVGFRLRPTRIALKAKLSQNHPLANRESVAQRLAGQASEHSREVAALMRATLARAPTGD